MTLMQIGDCVDNNILIPDFMLLNHGGVNFSLLLKSGPVATLGQSTSRVLDTKALLGVEHR